MNLAQCIPAEWAQDGCKPRYALARMANDLPPMGMVRHVLADGALGTWMPGVGPGSPAVRRLRINERTMVLKGLARYPNGTFVSPPELAGAICEPDLGSDTVTQLLYVLLKLRLVTREGIKRNFRYAITAAGRKEIA